MKEKIALKSLIGSRFAEFDRSVVNQS